ncbi:MAG TPA: S9 family peptidase [Woeseiaceae bacterium]
MKQRALCVSVVVLLASLATINVLARPLTIDDYDRVKDVGRPAISVDGRIVAFTLEDQLYVVPVAGGEPRAVTSDSSSASSPYWAKDGKSLFFLSDRSGSDQVWRLPLDTFGEATQLTDIDGGASSLDLSRDESRLLLIQGDKPGDEAASDESDEKEPWVITRRQFKEDAGDDYLTGMNPEHVYAYDLATEESQQLTAGRYTEQGAAWSPDGTEIVFVSNRDEDPDAKYGNELWVVTSTAESPATDEADGLRRLTTGDDVKDSPMWSPDGRYIAYLSAKDGVYGISRLAVVPAQGGEPRYLTEELDRWVSSPKFSADGRWIYFLYENHGGRHLGRVRLSDGRLERLLEGDLAVTGFDVDSRGGVVVRLSRKNEAPELYRLQNDKLARLTHVNDDFFASVDLGAKEKITYESDDGTLIEAFVTKPPGFREGQRYPTILDIHGGPVAQFSWGFSFDTQFLASKGYVVVQPNPRGSTGRGQAFIEAIYETWGITDYPDIVRAVDRTIELGYTDADALAVTGYSYGGYMTNVVITRSDRFKAAASGAGHSYIVANYGHDIYQRWYNWELGVPWDNREKYDRLSPLLQAGNVTTPTLFYGGREDWNVPILNAELFFQSLKQKGVDTELVVYPDSHHGGWDPRFEKDVLERIVAWFDRYTKAQ